MDEKTGEENPDIEKDLEWEVQMNFLGDILGKTQYQTNSLDVQTNIMLGIASAIFIFSVPQINSGNETSIVFVFLGVFAAISILIGLVSIHPPRFMRIKDKHESVKSLMGNKRATSYRTSQEYADSLYKTLGSLRRMTDHYAATIYNMNVNYYRPKRELFKASVDILIIGIGLSFLALIYQLFS